MRRAVLSLLVLLAGSAPALAVDTPEMLLQAIYAPYLKGDFDANSWDETKVRSKALNALFAKDKKEAEGDVGRLDFDPYVDGQDYTLTKLKIGTAVIAGDKATDEVTFDNLGSAEDLTFKFVKEADGWKIDDIVSKKKGSPYSLKAIMEGPLD